MSRYVVLFSVVVAILAAGGALLVGGAQEPTSAALIGRALIGAWRLDTNADDPTSPPSFAIFHADGTYVEVHPLVGVGIGAWRATGSRTADLTIVFPDVDPAAAVTAAGTLTVRGRVEADAAGTALRIPYRVEGRAPDGTVLYESALVATGVRLAVEAGPPAAPPVTAGASPTR